MMPPDERDDGTPAQPLPEPTMIGKWVRYVTDDGSTREGDVLERGLDAETFEEVCYIVRWRLGSTENVPAERVIYCELPA